MPDMRYEKIAYVVASYPIKFEKQIKIVGGVGKTQRRQRDEQKNNAIHISLRYEKERIHHEKEDGKKKQGEFSFVFKQVFIEEG